MIYLQLFWSFFQVGLFSIGGGYAALPLIENQVVKIHPWLTMTEFTDLITISQMTPGPIAINAATFVGTRFAGIWGSIIATVGCITPSCIIVLLLAHFYYQYSNLSAIEGALSGLRPAVVALIASAGLSILVSTFWETGFSFDVSAINIKAVGIFAVSLFILRKYKCNPIYVMTGAGIVGLIVYLYV